MLNKTIKYEIVNKDLNIIIYISDLAAHRLFKKGIYLTKKNKKVILHNATVLKIKSSLFTARNDTVPELKNNEINGNVYIKNNFLYCLLFPIDLIVHKHISVKKWKFDIGE